MSGFKMVNVFENALVVIIFPWGIGLASNAL
jgi:hypothetical protein